MCHLVLITGCDDPHTLRVALILDGKVGRCEGSRGSLQIWSTRFHWKQNKENLSNRRRSNITLCRRHRIHASLPIDVKYTDTYTYIDYTSILKYTHTLAHININIYTVLYSLSHKLSIGTVKVILENRWYIHCKNADSIVPKVIKDEIVLHWDL